MNIHKSFKIGLVFLLVSLCSAFAFAVETVKIGWFPYEQLQKVDENGNPSGYNHDYLKLISSQTDFHFEYVIDSYENCMKMLETGKIDLLGCVPDYDQTAKLCNFSILWEPPEFLYLYGKAINVDNFFDNADDFDKEFGFVEGKNVAILNDSTSVLAFKDFLDKYNLENVVFIECSDEETINNFVQSGFVDFGISSTQLDSAKYKVVSEFFNVPKKFAVSKRNHKLLNKLNSVAVKIASIQPWIYYDLYAEYGLIDDGLLVFSDEEKAFIKKHNTIIIAWTESSSYLIEQDSKTGEIRGFFPELFDVISKMSGIKFEYLHCPTLNDVIVQTRDNPNSVICFIDKKAEIFSNNYSFSFSAPIISMACETIRLKNPKTNSNKTGILQEHDFFQFLKNYSPNNFIKYDSEKEALKALKSGEIYQIIAHSHTAFSISDVIQNSDYVVEMIPNESIDFCFAQAGNADPKLISILSKVINSIPADVMDRTIVKSAIYIRNRYYQNLMQFLPWFVFAFTILIFALVTVILLSSLIKKNKHTKALSNQLYTDSLTSLLSQKGFDFFLDERLKKSDCKDWALIAFDMDGFGYYNALFGFDAGDKLLQDIAKACVKQCPHEELCAHINNDNFYLFVNESENSVEDRIEALNKAIHNIVPAYRINVPFGVFRIKEFDYENGDNSVQLTAARIRDCAKAAQRTVKGDVINNIGYYDSGLHKKLIEENMLTAEMENAISKHEFIPYFQPKYDCNQVIRGAEALVRWKKPNGELVMPGKFIPIFERNGFVLKLDMYIFEETCKVLQKQKMNGLKPVPISTNFSKGHVYNRNFAKQLAEIAGKYDIEPRLLEIELTESVFCENSALVADVIDSIHSYGFVVSIDDFGSGYSSLNMLKDTEFDSIKIDQVFFRGDIDKIKKVVCCILTLAKSLGMKTVAEGVESVAQFNFLKENGCDVIQGFYFSKPVDEETFTKLL